MLITIIAVAIVMLPAIYVWYINIGGVISWIKGLDIK
jgi:hypothetical protein